MTTDDELYGTETFGPMTGVATFRDFDEAMELANNHGYGLSSAIYTTDPAEPRSASASGSAPAWCRVNNSTSGAEAHLPFGGNGKSGNGSRQSGIWVLDQFTALAVDELGLRASCRRRRCGRRRDRRRSRTSRLE